MPWLTLKLSSFATSPDRIPKYYERDNVSGDVIIVAEHGDSISSVSAQVTGRVITGAGPTDSITFLDVVVPLWAKASSRSSSPLAGQAENMPPKLHGTFKFPFSIPLPTTAAFEYQKFSLPHSFSEKHTRASVVYELSVHVSRGKMRANNKLVTPFGYVPSSKPPSASQQRLMAYEQKLEIPGPSRDENGWQALDGHELAIALPLAYTRSSVIPMALPPFLLDSSDVRLRRRITCRLSSGLVETKDDFIADASWWDGQEDLRGEVKLDKGLMPTTSLGRWFDVSYALVCFSPTGTTAVAEVPVEINTSFAAGPKPISNAPPPNYTSSVNVSGKPRVKRRSENYQGPYTQLYSML